MTQTSIECCTTVLLFLLALPLAAQIPVTIGDLELEISAQDAASLEAARVSDFTDPDEHGKPLHATVEELIAFILNRSLKGVAERHPTSEREAKEAERRAIEAEIEQLERIVRPKPRVPNGGGR